MNNIMAIFMLASSGVSAVSMLRMMITAKTLTGEGIGHAVKPVLDALTMVFPKVTFPETVVKECAEACAAVVNGYYHPVAALPVGHTEPEPIKRS